jgi:Cof subfamily protein (haloacid dehalogenase superfamily)
MEHIKIIFFDVDGTLVDMQKKKISPNTVAALQRLREKGIRICMATGRTPVTVPHFDGVEFDAYLTFNGSYCYDSSGEIFSNPLDGEDVLRLIDNAAALGRPVSIATRDRVTANGWDAELEMYYGFAHIPLETHDDVPQVARQPVYQVMLACNQSDHPALLEGVKGAKITGWWDKAVDIIPASCGKGRGVEAILQHYGLAKEAAMAFGDGNNDIELLQAVGRGVAMENASPQLKAVAGDICGHVADDGIYHYLRANGLI